MARPILETLAQIHGGVLLDAAADKLSELVLAVDSSGKPGKLIIEIQVRKAAKNTMAVSGEVKLTLPKAEKAEALFFPTPEGHLLGQDPRQQKLDLSEVRIPSGADLAKAG